MKNILVSCWCVALCLGLLLYSLPSKPAQVDDTSFSVEPTTAMPDPVPFYVSINDPDQQEVWEQLAQEFNLMSGFHVLIASDIPATDDAVLLTMTARQLEEPMEDFLDLSGTAAFANLAQPDFARIQDDQVVAIAADMAIFGLIYDETLLAQAGYTRSDVDSFEDLKAVAEHISADTKKLGFGAFAKAKANLSQLLASYPADCRGIWDLYQANHVEEPIVGGKAVFCLGSNLDYEELSEKTNAKLGMLPLYIGSQPEENHTFCAVTTRYWCIRPGNEDSNQAAIAFLNFLVSPRIDGTLPVDDLKLLAPYRQATFSDNSAENLLRSDIAVGKQCQICVNPSVPDGLMEALAVYQADPTEQNWAAVLQLLSHA